MPALESQNSLCSLDAREFKLLRALIERHTGIWLRDGKQIMLASRLGRRLRHHGLSNFTEYYQLLQAESGSREIGELINCVTTNKTSFFREPHHFDFLTQTVVPEILSQAGRNQPKTISIWSAACSTGEEPYSIAVTLLESLEKARVAPEAWEIQVIASDIDTKVLHHAAEGVYDQNALSSIPAAQRKKYFLRGKGEMADRIKVKAKVASLVHFQRLNLMETVWPLNGPFDTIFFRNALIYFQQETQDLFLRKMARLLKPRGYLILGHSEHIPWLHELLEPLNRTVYRLRDRR
jgi:chemotaxis protein methyltransferase CheR